MYVRIFTLFVYVNESRLFCVTATVFSCNTLNRNRVSFAVTPVLLADTEADDVGICVCEIGSLFKVPLTEHSRYPSSINVIL